MSLANENANLMNSSVMSVGFSTIDLTVHSAHSPEVSHSSSGYTSFGQSFNTSSPSNQIPRSLTMPNSDEHLARPSLAAMNSSNLMAKTVSTIENLKEWSKSAYKCTRQMVCEKLGKTSRTVDTELEIEIEGVRETRKKYEHMLQLSRALTNHFYHLIQTQKGMSELFGDLAQKTPELREDFDSNALTQRTLAKHGETLMSALNCFSSTLQTLCTKSIEDTMITVRSYEAARVEFDAYRSDLDVIKSGAKGDFTKQKSYIECEKKYLAAKEKYERLRSDVTIKIKFLDENKVKVMQKQLAMFHNTIAAYFSGNKDVLEATMKQFSIKIANPVEFSGDKMSFLEKM